MDEVQPIVKHPVGLSCIHGLKPPGDFCRCPEPVVSPAVQWWVDDVLATRERSRAGVAAGPASGPRGRAGSCGSSGALGPRDPGGSSRARLESGVKPVSPYEAMSAAALWAEVVARRWLSLTLLELLRKALAGAAAQLAGPGQRAGGAMCRP